MREARNDWPDAHDHVVVDVIAHEMWLYMAAHGTPAGQG
jgi:hypothetical protein